MGLPALVGDQLLPGRYLTTEADLHAAFVDAPAFRGSKTRARIWRDWEAARALLTGSVLVHSAWISGSFLTTKVDPGDIDVTFVVSGEDRATRPVGDQQVIESFIQRVRSPLGAGAGVVPAHGLKVDSYIIDWSPHQPTGTGKLTPSHQRYAVERGYWDDWWSRKRLSPKGSVPVRGDAIPQRGYVEVIFNAYV